MSDIRPDENASAADGLAGRKRPTLTQRAALSFAVKLARMLLRSVATFLTTPVILAGLGPQVFGVWSMIQKLSGYISLADFRASGAVKLLLSVRQHEQDDEANRRIVGASLVVWLCFLPLMALLGLLLLANVRHLLPLEDLPAVTARWAFAIFLAGIVFSRVTALPGNILQAVNLGYHAVAAEVLVPIVTAIGLVAVVKAGWGLIGVAAVTVAGLVLDGVLRHIVARREIPWYGAARPRRADMRGFVGITGWMQLTNLANLLLWGVDILLVGRIMGGEAATILVQTGFLHRTMTESVSFFFSSGRPGLVGLIGEGRWDKARLLRREINLLALAMALIAGAVILAIDADFVARWVGREYFAGSGTNIFLVVGSVLTVIVRNEAMLLDGLLAVRVKALTMLGVGFLTVVAGALLIRTYGIAGMAGAWAAGQVLLLTIFRAVVTRGIGDGGIRVVSMVVKGAVIVALCVGAGMLGRPSADASWASVITKAILAAVFAGLVCWVVVLDRGTRDLLRLRIRSLALMRGDG